MKRGFLLSHTRLVLGPLKRIWGERPSSMTCVREQW